MIRAQVLDELRARVALDDYERSCILWFIAELDRLTEPFSEFARPTHVTGSGIVVGSRGVVLHRHRILGTWTLPGGHVDEGETPAETALRETMEETGLTVAHPGGVPRLVHVDVHSGPRGHTHLDLRYLLDGGEADPCPGPGESQEVAWFSLEEAFAIAGPRLGGVLQSCVEPAT